MIVGAVLGGLGVVIGERLRWRREDKQRWLQTRRDVYGDFLIAVDRWDRLDDDAALHGEFQPEGDITQHPDMPKRLKAMEAADEAFARLSDLELMGVQAVIDQAQQLYDSTRQVAFTRYDFPPRGCGGMSDELVKVCEQRRKSRDAYVATVRNELGATS